MTSSDVFTTETAGLPEVARPSVIRLRDGDHLDLDISPVRKELAGAGLRNLMPEINRASDPSNMIWQLIDRETGAENGAIS